MGSGEQRLWIGRSWFSRSTAEAPTLRTCNLLDVQHLGMEDAQGGADQGARRERGVHRSGMDCAGATGVDQGAHEAADGLQRARERGDRLWTPQRDTLQGRAYGVPEMGDQGDGGERGAIAQAGEVHVAKKNLEAQKVKALEVDPEEVAVLPVPDTKVDTKVTMDAKATVKAANLDKNKKMTTATTTARKRKTATDSDDSWMRMKTQPEPEVLEKTMQLETELALLRRAQHIDPRGIKQAEAVLAAERALDAGSQDHLRDSEAWCRRGGEDLRHDGCGRRQGLPGGHGPGLGQQRRLRPGRGVGHRQVSWEKGEEVNKGDGDILGSEVLAGLRASDVSPDDTFVGGRKPKRPWCSRSWTLRMSADQRWTKSSPT